MRNKEYSCPNGCTLPPRRKTLKHHDDGTYGFDYCDFTFCPNCGSLMPYSKEKLQRFFEVYTVHPLLDTAVQLLYKSWIITILDFCNVCQAEEIISFEVPLYVDFCSANDKLIHFRRTSSQLILSTTLDTPPAHPATSPRNRRCTTDRLHRGTAWCSPSGDAVCRRSRRRRCGAYSAGSRRPCQSANRTPHSPCW